MSFAALAPLLQELGQGGRSFDDLLRVLEARGAAAASPAAQALDPSLLRMPPPQSLRSRPAASSAAAVADVPPPVSAAEDVAAVAPAAAGPDLDAFRAKYRDYANNAYVDMVQAGMPPEQAQAELQSWMQAFREPSPIPESEMGHFQGQPGGMARLYQEFHPQFHPDSYGASPNDLSPVPAAPDPAGVGGAVPAPGAASEALAPNPGQPNLAELDAMLRGQGSPVLGMDPGAPNRGYVPPPTAGRANTMAEPAEIGHVYDRGTAVPTEGASVDGRKATLAPDSYGFEPIKASTFTKDPEGFMRRTSYQERIPVREHLLDGATEETLPYWQSRAQESSALARRLSQRGDTKGADSAMKSAGFWSSLIEDFVVRNEDTPAELRRNELGSASALTQDEDLANRARQTRNANLGTEESNGAAAGYTIDPRSQTITPSGYPGSNIDAIGSELGLDKSPTDKLVAPPKTTPAQYSTQLRQLLGSLNRISLRPEDAQALQNIGARLPHAADAELPQMLEQALGLARDQKTGELPPAAAEGAFFGKRQDIEHGRNLPPPTIVDPVAQNTPRTSLEEGPTQVNRAREEINNAPGVKKEDAHLAEIPKDPRERYSKAMNLLTQWETGGLDSFGHADALYLVRLATTRDRSPKSMNRAEHALLNLYDAEE